MCPFNDEVAKLREYRRLDRLNRDQMAEEMCLESGTNSIHQNAGGFSLVNENNGPVSPPGICDLHRRNHCPGSHHLLLAQSKKLPAPVVIPPQLPFSQFPPIVQDFDFRWVGYQGYPVPQLEFRGREAVQYHQRPAVRHSSSRFIELSDEPEPAVHRQGARCSQTPVSTPVPVSASASRSSSRTRFSNAPSGLDSDAGLSGAQTNPDQEKKHRSQKNEFDTRLLLFQPTV